jgi:hypothetical protein
MLVCNLPCPSSSWRFKVALELNFSSVNHYNHKHSCREYVLRKRLIIEHTIMNKITGSLLFFATLDNISY